MGKVFKLFCFMCCLMLLAVESGQARSLADDWIQGLVVDRMAKPSSEPAFLRKVLKMEL